MARLEGPSARPRALFHDEGFFRAIRQDVVPLLRTYPSARIWVPACAAGANLHSLAIILQEEGIYDRCRIYATDLTEKALERAAGGLYTPSALRAAAGRHHASGGRVTLAQHFTIHGQQAALVPALHRNIVYAQHNLATDAGFNEFHLILSRDLGLAASVRDRVHELFFHSLVRFGVLALGQTGSLDGTPHAFRYQPLVDGAPIYRRGR